MSSRLYFNLFATPPHPCSYLTEYQAITVFIDPYYPKNINLYDQLSQHGFRRSGEHIYRPHCQQCESCISVRIPVAHFTPKRTQKRIWQNNQAIQVIPQEAKFNPQHFQLYSRYLASRHAGGGMDNPTPSSYMQFLTCDWTETTFYEFHLHGELVAVAVVDHLLNGLSAIYTFFEPTLNKLSLGVYAILWEIEAAKQLNKTWLYLGYWVANSRKMSYKINYQPLEIYYQGIWQPYSHHLFSP